MLGFADLRVGAAHATPAPSPTLPPIAPTRGVFAEGAQSGRRKVDRIIDALRDGADNTGAISAVTGLPTSEISAFICMLCGQNRVTRSELTPQARGRAMRRYALVEARS